MLVQVLNSPNKCQLVALIPFALGIYLIASWKTCHRVANDLYCGSGAKNGENQSPVTDDNEWAHMP